MNEIQKSLNKSILLVLYLPIQKTTFITSYYK